MFSVCSCALFEREGYIRIPAPTSPAKARPGTARPQVLTAPESRVVRSQEETNKAWGYLHGTGAAARIELAEVKRGNDSGDDISLVLTYMVLTHSDKAIHVTETMEVWQESRLLGSSETHTERGGGTYESVVRLRLPETAGPGTYKVVCIVRTPYSRDLCEAGFSVRGR
jgi:hypothetical protein